MVIPFLKGGRPRTERSDGSSQQSVFSRLVTPHLAALYRLAYRFTGRQHEAEDLLQELLTRLYARTEQLSRIEILRPWLARALYNLYVDERRRFARSPLGHLATGRDTAAQDVFASRPAQDADLDLLTEMAQMRQHLADLLEQLPQEQRAAVILHDIEGYELHEAAEILAVPLGTVKSRLHRAHERLRAGLRERNLSPAAVVLSNEGPGGTPELPAERASRDELS